VGSLRLAVSGLWRLNSASMVTGLSTASSPGKRAGRRLAPDQEFNSRVRPCFDR
jgi:hypothetical protein